MRFPYTESNEGDYLIVFPHQRLSSSNINVVVEMKSANNQPSMLEGIASMEVTSHQVNESEASARLNFDSLLQEKVQAAVLNIGEEGSP